MQNLAILTLHQQWINVIASKLCKDEKEQPFLLPASLSLPYFEPKRQPKMQWNTFNFTFCSHVGTIWTIVLTLDDSFSVSDHKIIFLHLCNFYTGSGVPPTSYKKQIFYSFESDRTINSLGICIRPVVLSQGKFDIFYLCTTSTDNAVIVTLLDIREIVGCYEITDSLIIHFIKSKIY